MVYIYILKLQHGKYYIGKTMNPSIRVSNHFKNKITKWTSKYKPLELVKVIPDCDDFDEDKYTKMYMDKFGIDNVRGGSYVSERLMKYQKMNIKRELTVVKNCCFNCGKPGHFVNNCPEYFNKNNFIDEE